MLDLDRRSDEALWLVLGDIKAQINRKIVPIDPPPGADGGGSTFSTAKK